MNYISISDIIKYSHRMHDASNCMVFDHSYHSKIGYWYAENRLYVLKDDRTGAIYFEEAWSPKQAVDNVVKRLEAVG